MAAVEILAIVLVFPWLVVGLRFVAKAAYDFIDGVLPALFVLFTAAAAWLALAAGMTVVANLTLEHHDSYETVELVALQDGSVTAGAFFLGIGTIDGEPVYTYYESNGPAKRLASTKAAGVQVYEDTESPYLVQFTGCELSIPWLAGCFASTPQVNEIHVPAGTIRNNFELDAQ